MKELVADGDQCRSIPRSALLGAGVTFLITQFRTAGVLLLGLAAGLSCTRNLRSKVS